MRLATGTDKGRGTAVTAATAMAVACMLGMTACSVPLVPGMRGAGESGDPDETEVAPSEGGAGEEAEELSANAKVMAEALPDYEERNEAEDGTWGYTSEESAAIVDEILAKDLFEGHVGDGEVVSAKMVPGHTYRAEYAGSWDEEATGNTLEVTCKDGTRYYVEMNHFGSVNVIRKGSVDGEEVYYVID